jgi:cytochrome P450
LRSRIEKVVSDHLDAMERSFPPVDLVEAFALPIPSITICDVLGVPYSHRKDFHQNTWSLFSLEASAEEGAAAMASLTELLLEQIHFKRAHPANDLLSELVTDHDLADREIAGVGVLLLTAGHETTANMLALGTFTLLSYPDEIAALRASPSLIEGAVDELLRYLTIFQFGVPRAPLEDVEVDGQLLKAGESVTIYLPAANRDPTRFTDPDTLSVKRDAKGHLAFGYGVHQCIGQHLARLELRVGYSALFERFPTLHLAVPPAEIPVRTDGGIYGVHQLPVGW